MKTLVKDLKKNFRASIIVRAIAIIFTDLMGVLFSVGLGDVLSEIAGGGFIETKNWVQFCFLLFAMVVISPYLLFWSNKLILKESVLGDELLFQYFLKQEPSGILEKNAGETAEKLQDDGIELRWSIIDMHVYTAELVVSIFLFGYLLLTTDIFYIAVVAGLVVINWVKAKGLGKSCARSTARAMGYQQKFEHYILQGASAIEYIAINRLGSRIVKKLKKENEQYTKNGLIPKGRWEVVKQAVSALYDNISYLIVLLVGLYMCKAGMIEIGVVLTMSLYYGILSNQFSSMDSIVHAKRMKKEMVEDLKHILNDPKEILDGTFQELIIRPFQFDRNGKLLYYKNYIQIKKGDKVAITGTNGCGKTTLLYCILGLLRETEGSILLNGCGIDIGKIKGFTDYIDIKSELMGDKVGSYLQGSGCEEHLSEAMGLMCVSKLLKKNGDELSGGERRRIDLARVLSREKDVIAMDEPENFLDTEWKQKAIDVWENSSATMIYTTHDPDFIELANVVIRI